MTFDGPDNIRGGLKEGAWETGKFEVGSKVPYQICEIMMIAINTSNGGSWSVYS